MSTTSTIADPPDEPLPPQRPLERFAQVETDIFCEGCGYNLHGQAVERDQRLGLMVCRCPECGRYHAAGQGTAATSLWISRLASLLLFLWVLIVLTAVFFTVIGYGALQLLSYETFTTYQMRAPDGRVVTYTGGAGAGLVYEDTNQPFIGQVRHVRAFGPYPNDPRVIMSDYAFVAGFCAAIGIISGALLVIFLWHWPRRRYFWVLLLPVLAAGVLCLTAMYDQTMDFVRAWTIRQILLWCGVQMLFIAIGILLGRPVARTLLRMFVPPKPLQQLAFLWRADGKAPPPAPAEFS